MKCRCPDLAGALTGPCSRCGAYVDGLHAPGVAPTTLYCPACCPGSADFTQHQRLVIHIAAQTLATLRPGDKPLLKLAGSGRLTADQAERALAMVRKHQNTLPAEVQRLTAEIP